jgi:arabinofuranan 3-O-arabinosyltransferase
MALDAVPSNHIDASQLSRPVELTGFALCVATVVYLVASFIQGSWILDSNGQQIATDFVNVWASGRQVVDGNPAAAYDLLMHKEAEVAAVGHPFAGEYPWIYPPTFLFVATLLALLPFVPAYATWIALTFPAYLAAVRAIIGHRAGFLFACAYPGILSNMMVGQNGFATAALLGGSLFLMQRRPMLAGCFIGLLSFKPHLGLLLPLVLIAGGQWRAIVAAAAVTLLLVLASGLVFGLDTWHAFLQSLSVASQSTLIEGRADWGKLHSAFAVVRLLGGSATLAWTVHLTLASIVAILLCAMWRSKISFDLKAAALATGALLVTPYLFLYDLVVLAVPMAFLIRAGWSTGHLRGEMLGLGLASLFVLIFPLLTAPVGLAAILLVSLLIARRVRHALALAGERPEYLPLSVQARSSAFSPVRPVSPALLSRWPEASTRPQAGAE